MPGILESLRIVEGSAFVAAPLGGMTLAQLGADVIRFDPLGGWLDRGRRREAGHVLGDPPLRIMASQCPAYGIGHGFELV